MNSGSGGTHDLSYRCCPHPSERKAKCDSFTSELNRSTLQEHLRTYIRGSIKPLHFISANICSCSGCYY
ncbi:hypothetical protein JTB14_001920 [Gonioctena quinquepunctata]|nr:hypothetical protein JTB14_001920 [Gonioctena quinquepunctata]